MVPVAIAIAAVVVATVPGGISIKVIVVVNDVPVIPIDIPGTPSPPATPSAARERTKGNAAAEPEQRPRGEITGRVPGSHIRRPIDYGWIVLRNIDHLWVRGFDDDGVGRLLGNCDLGTGLEIALSLGLRTQGLYGCHNLRRLVVISLAQR